MSKLPRDISGERVIRALGRAGWYRDHQVGSHVTLRHRETPGKKVVVPVHSGPVKLKILHRILHEVGLSVEQFRDLV